jgi:hypothetical protein
MRPRSYAKWISDVTTRVRSTNAALNMRAFSGVRDIQIETVANACAHKRLWRHDTIVSAVLTAPRNDARLEVVGEPAGEVAAGSNNPELSFGTSVPSRTCLNATSKE